MKALMRAAAASQPHSTPPPTPSSPVHPGITQPSWLHTLPAQEVQTMFHRSQEAFEEGVPGMLVKNLLGVTSVSSQLN